MTRTRTVAALAAALAVLASLAVAANVSASRAATPITIGWAYDGNGNMKPFDTPALAAAKIRVAQINAKGGVDGRPLKIITCDTQGNTPARAKTCALQLIGKGSNIIFTTCDVDYATPVVQASINKGLLTIAPCIGTDQMGPKRFGAKKGKLAFSFGNVAQDEGSAMAQFAWNKGWRTAGTATNTLLVYFQNVVQAFEARFKQLGGKIVSHQTYATGQNNVQNAITQLNSKKADVYVTSTSFGELPAFANGFQTLGNNTPVLNSWAGDGTYWLPKSPTVKNYYAVTFASVFGDDPNPALNKLAKQIHAGTGGFLGGVSAIDGVVAAIKQAKGSTDGATLAAKMVKFHNLPTIAGSLSFSTQYHTVFGRQYRVIEINNNKAKLVGLVKAKVVPKI